MQIAFDDAPFPVPAGGSVVTIGVFDGVHRGHQALIAEAQRHAAEYGCPTVVVTFDRHPASVVRPDSAPRLLTDLDQKLATIAALGVDYAYVIRFDERRSLESPEVFVDEMVARLAPRMVVVGENFHFGHRRRGDIALLAELGASAGFKVVGINLVDVEGVDGPVSSTAVRAALAEGDVVRAELFLGRPYRLRGVVEHGDARGRELGFPTANVAVPGDAALPGDGVYGGWFHRADGSRHRAAVSIGRRPTFYAEHGTLLVEAYLLDFSGDLYGESVAITFDQRVRGQARFNGLDALIAQMQADVAAVRAAGEADAAPTSR